MLNSKRLYIIACLAFLSQACGSKDKDTDTTIGSKTYSFTDDINPILVQNCSGGGCHGSGGASQMDFIGAQDIVEEKGTAGEILRRISLPSTNPEKMPDGQELSSSDLETLKSYFKSKI